MMLYWILLSNMKIIISLIKKIINKKDNNIISNKNNPFSYGDPSAISRQIEQKILWKTFNNSYNASFLKKNPSWERLFIHFENKNNDIDVELMILYQIIKIYKKELYKNEIYPSKYIKLEFDIFYIDLINFEMKMRVNKNLNKIFNLKYKYLCSQGLIDIYNIYHKNNISFKYLNVFLNKQKYICKTPDLLLKELKEYIKKKEDFSYIKIKNKLLKNKVKIIYDNNNVIIIKINNFQEMQKYGSKIWCITNQIDMFNKYTKNSEQYLIYNFDKMEVDSEHMLGVTFSLKTKTISHTYDSENKMLEFYSTKDLILKKI
jgi:hypothetical protein